MEKINSEVLLRNARNYIQYCVITRNGKESEKDYAYTESLRSIAETITTL